jgi:nitrite reductase/ring-hydroxylating ferredoxin subunit
MKCFWLLCSFFLLLISCSKDETGRIWDVPVNYRVTLQEFQIKNQNNVLLVNDKGVAGLIIYKRPDGGFSAFDRCSSVNPEKKCAVIPDDPSLTATDPCSGAKFSLYDGAPVKAPAVRSLKQYQINVSNYDILVTN